MRIDSRELLAVGIFGRNSRLVDRIEILLQQRRKYSPRPSPSGMITSSVALCALLVAGSLAPRWIAFAQQTRRPAFEVASIKPGDPNNDKMNVWMGNNGFTAENVTPKQLIGFAYDVRDYQILGGPAWLDSMKFTVQAKIPSGRSLPPGAIGLPSVGPMLQSLLQERFRLAIHHEAKEGSVYELIVAKGGPKLKRAAESGFVRPRKGDITVMGAPVPVFAKILSQDLDRPVIDKTGISGDYNFLLTYAPEEAGIIEDPDRPAVFTAVQEQLGLRLRPAKGPVEFIVIDHVERPDAN